MADIEDYRTYEHGIDDLDFKKHPPFAYIRKDAVLFNGAQAMYRLVDNRLAKGRHYAR